MLLSLMLTAPCLAQETSGPPICSVGTIGGKCINAAVAIRSMQWSRALVNNVHQIIPAMPPSHESSLSDPIHPSDKLQPKAGLNATGPTALSGMGGGPVIVYGRWK